jgi:hypothetical protein
MEDTHLPPFFYILFYFLFRLSFYSEQKGSAKPASFSLPCLSAVADVEQSSPGWVASDPLTPASRLISIARVLSLSQQALLLRPTWDGISSFLTAAYQLSKSRAWYGLPQSSTIASTFLLSPSHL